MRCVRGPSPLIWMRWPIAKPSPAHDRPSRRLRLVAVDVISKASDSGMLPPPWTTVRPPCGPGTKTVRVALAALGSSDPRASVSVRPSVEISCRRQLPSSPSIITSWPASKPSARQSPAARVTVPPAGPPADRHGERLRHRRVAGGDGAQCLRRDGGRAGEVHDGVDDGVGRIVVAERDDGPRPREAGDLDRLAGEEALRLPVERLRAREVDAGRAARRARPRARRDLHRADELHRRRRGRSCPGRRARRCPGRA